jgi:hypothetical protein
VEADEGRSDEVVTLKVDQTGVQLIAGSGFQVAGPEERDNAATLARQFVS